MWGGEVRREGCGRGGEEGRCGEGKYRKHENVPRYHVHTLYLPGTPSIVLCTMMVSRRVTTIDILIGAHRGHHYTCKYTLRTYTDCP